MTTIIGKDKADALVKKPITEYLRYYDDATAKISKKSIGHLVEWKYIEKTPGSIRCLAPVYRKTDLPILSSFVEKMGTVVLEQLKETKTNLRDSSKT